MENENNNLMVFEGHNVEIFEWEGKVLFNPKHVAECLEIKDVNSSIRNFNEKQVIKLTNLDVHDMHIRKLNNRGESFLTESGVYKLIFKSHKEEAEKFQDWVTDEVLPTIRKTGGYIPVDEGMTDSEIMARALLIAQGTINKKDELIKQHEKTIEQQKPLVDFANTIASTSKSIDMSSFAKLIKDEGIKMGRNKLFEWLRNNGYLMKNKNNEPYQRYIDSKIFEVVEYTITINGKSEPKIKTLVTGKGQIYLIKKLKEQNKINN